MDIRSLEDYVIILGTHAASLATLAGVQKDVARIGILEEAEIANAQGINEEIAKLLTMINDQCRLVGGRSPAGWEGLMERVKTRLLKKERRDEQQRPSS